MNGDIFFLIILVSIAVFIVTTLFQWLWNTTIPEISTLKPITFWQSFRLLLISTILLGGARLNLGGLFG